MSAPNFISVKDFPLIVAKDEYARICPECGCFNGATDEKCADCGCDISEVESVYDECLMSNIVSDMENVAARINGLQKFFEVSVESGRYSGVQFLVTAKCDNLEDFTNEDAHYEFGMCRSKMLRAAKVAKNKVRKALYNAKDELLGLTELACIALFSNGEAIYTIVDTRKPLPVKTAVKAALSA